jgi:cell cycle sensor histidine kinase DivJ
VDFVLSNWPTLLSKLEKSFSDPIHRLSEDWLSHPFYEREETERLTPLLSSLIAWTVLTPFLSLLWTLPAFSLATSFALALIISGSFMLAAGILVQTRKCTFAKTFTLVSTALFICGYFIATNDATMTMMAAITVYSFSRQYWSGGLVHSSEQATLLQTGIKPQAQLINALPGLVTRHSTDANVLSVHGLAPEAISARADNLLGKGFINQIYVSDRIEFFSAIDKLRQGEKHITLDLRFETGFDKTRQNEVPSSGQFKHLKSNLIGIHNAAGELVEFYIQNMDVTEELEMKAQFDELSEAARDADVTKTSFLAGVSHELRTPLNSIMGFADVLIHEVIAPLPDERHKEYVKLIRESGEHLLTVVNTMLDMSKIQNGQYSLYNEPFEFKPLLDRTKSMLDIQASKKKINLTCRAAKDLPEITADSRALQQILINLVGNAIKFTQDRGVVTVDAHVENHLFTLCVSDTGIGIPADKLSQIGQPFMQVNSTHARQYEGTGLGISLVKGLVDLHKGEFLIESIEGQGTQVTITIPQLGSDMDLMTDDNSHEDHEGVHVKEPELVQTGAVHQGGETNVA